MVRSIKNLFTKLKTSLMFWYFILILLLFLPTVVIKPSFSFRASIATGIGIDKTETGLALSALTISQMSKQDMNENNKLVSSEGNSLIDALYNLEGKIGRKLKFGHVSFIVVSLSLKDEDIGKLLDPLVRTNRLPDSVSIVLSNVSAQETMSLANSLELSSSFRLAEIIQNEFNEDFTKDTSLDSFFKGYYSPLGVSTLGYLEITTDKSNGIDSSSSTPPSGSSSGGTQTSGGTSQSAEQKPTVIELKAENAVFKNGIYKYILNENEMKGIDWIVDENIQQSITIKNVNEQGMEDARITFDVQDKSISRHSSFIGGKPTLSFDLKLKLNIVEILQDGNNKISVQETKISENIEQSITNEIKKQIGLAIQKQIEEKTELMEIYNTFYSYNYEQFTNFLNSLENKDDFLQNVNIRLKVFVKLV